MTTVLSVVFYVAAIAMPMWLIYTVCGLAVNENQPRAIWHVKTTAMTVAATIAIVSIVGPLSGNRDDNEPHYRYSRNR